MKKIYPLISGFLILWSSALLAAPQQTGAAKPTFFGKVFSFTNIESNSVTAAKTNEIPPVMGIAINKDSVVKPVVDNSTVTNNLKAFTVKDKTFVGSTEGNLIHLGFVDANNVAHQIEIPPVMVTGVVLDSNNAVRYIEVEPNTIKVNDVEGGSAVEIPPVMGIPPVMNQENVTR